jgi:drug/metabolite transporter (DMT)-like permease
VAALRVPRADASALLAPRYGVELLRVRDWKLQALRAAMLAAMTALNFWALQYLQLAETGAIQFSVPLLIALFSAWWLGERLDARRWLAIVAGFAGVLLVIRPGSQAFHPAILLSVATRCSMQPSTCSRAAWWPPNRPRRCS